MKWLKDLVQFFKFIIKGSDEPALKDAGNVVAINEKSKEQPTPPPPKREQKYMYIIDAGHGGIEPKTGLYTTAPAKMFDHGSFVFYEGVFNRQVADRLFRMMDAEGLEYIKTYHEYKDTSLFERVKVANETWKKKKCVFFSIHGNAASSPKATGIEFFTSKGKTMSDVIAEKMYENTTRFIPELPLRIDPTDGDRDKEANFYVLRSTNCPAVLAEFGFFTNPDEARLMLSPDFQNRCAKVILQTMKYLEQ